MRATPTITSRRNPRIVEARKLAQRKHRERQGRFLVEGVLLLELALTAGATPQEAFYCQGQLDEPQGPALLNALEQAGAELVGVSPEVMDSLAERQAAEGVLATFPLPEYRLDDLDLAHRSLVLVLDRLQDPGNLGTLIRTADAVGASAVVLIEPCVDPFDPKTVRSSMGSLFNLPVVRAENIRKLFLYLSQRGLRAVAADAHQGVSWGEGLWHQGVALVLGNEARGLSPDVQPYIENWARLPVVGRAESLNVAVAGGVLMYTWLREQLRGGS